MTDVEIATFVIPRGTDPADIFDADSGARTWQSLSEDQRHALTDLVRTGLKFLLEDVDAWLPKAVMCRNPETLGVALAWRLPKLDDAVLLTRQRALTEEQARIDDLTRMARGVTHDPGGAL